MYAAVLLRFASVSYRFSVSVLLRQRYILPALSSSSGSSGTALFCSTFVFPSRVKAKKRTQPKSRPGQSEFLILTSLLLFSTSDIWVHEFQLLRVPCDVFHCYLGRLNIKLFNMKKRWSIVTISCSCIASSSCFYKCFYQLPERFKNITASRSRLAELMSPPEIISYTEPLLPRRNSRRVFWVAPPSIALSHSLSSAADSCWYWISHDSFPNFSCVAS